MQTAGLRHNQLSAGAFSWYCGYLAALDAKDLELYGSFLAENCSMQINSAPPVEGKKAVLAALAQYWTSFGALEHDLLNLYGDDSAFMLEALNHYTRLDGVPVTLRAVALTDRDTSGQVASFRLYTDTAALFAK